MKDPLLSIITVTKNCQNTIERTLESVQKVKTNDVEFLIIDGVSTDQTLSRIKKYNNIVDVLISEADSGVYNAMNKGAKLAKGKYLIFLNGDDEFIPSAFLSALKLVASNHSKIITFQCEIISTSNQYVTTMTASPSCLPYFNTVPHPSTFIERKLLLERPYSELLKISSDYDFFLKCWLENISFSLQEGVIARHYQGGLSTTHTSLSILENRGILKKYFGIYFYLKPIIRRIALLKNLVDQKQLWRILYLYRKKIK